MRPVDATVLEAERRASSMEEKKFLRNSNASYQRFLQENAQDGEMDKELDAMIDKLMQEGKDD